MTSKTKINQFKWLAATLMLVAAMVMPSTAWAQSSITPSKPSGEGTEASPYQISSAAELYWFAGLVNGDARVCDYDAENNQSGTQQNKAAWAKLTADIVVNSNLQSSLTFDNETGAVTNGTNFNAWTPIGNNSNQYTGTFDGANHTISGLYFNSATDKVGLFGYISNGTIKNVGVVDSYLWGRIHVGGVCGYNDQGTMENCYNKGTVSGVGNHVGGVCGDNRGTMENCYNTGAVRGDKKGSGGVCGNNQGTVTNCYNIGAVCGYYDIGAAGGVCGLNDGTIANCYSAGAFSGNGGGVCGLNYDKINNCYYDFDKFAGKGVYDHLLDGKSEKVEEKTSEQFKSGEVAYLLSLGCKIGETTYDGSTWGQNLSDGGGEYPVFNPNKKVFRGFVDCKLTFSNSNEGLSQTQANHNFNDEGFCRVCKAYQPATKNESDVYEIRNAGQLYWFAALVKGDTNQQGITEQNLAANAKLMNDITVNRNVLDANGDLNSSGSFTIWRPIGFSGKNYKGTFDGNNHTISGLYYSSTIKCEVGLFGCVAYGGVIKNVGVVDSYFKGIFITGGLCGYNGFGTISNCYNASTVIGELGSASEEIYVGGICGQNNGTITNCYSRGKVDGPSNDNSHVGGLCGFNNYKYITNCYYDSNIYTGSAVGKNLGTKTANVEGKTTAQFKSGEVAWLLNGRKSEGTEEAPLMWYQNINTGTLDAYPLLGSNGHGIVYASAPCPSKFSNTNDLAEEKHNYVANADYTIHTCTKCGETHNAVFTVNDETDKISACHDFGSVTLNAPTGNLTYDKTAKAAYIEGALTGIETPKILYKEKNATEEATETAPIDAGTYTASITYTIGGVDYSVSVEYTIEKAEDVPNRPYGLSGCIGAKLSNVSLKDNEGWSWDNPEQLLPETVGESVTGKASYNGEDKDNYINITAVDVTITANAHPYSSNGFCEICHEYEPAQLVSDNHHSELNSTHNGYYAIENAGQLYWFADKVNNDNTNFGSANAVLTANITVNSSLKENLNSDGSLKEGYVVRNWTPIGWYDNANSKAFYFSGTFDGNGKSISGLYYYVESSDAYVYAGLFGLSNGTIKNVSVEDSYFRLNGLDNSVCRVGCVCGGNLGAITNCHNASNFTVTVNHINASVGGVCGHNFPQGIIENCNNTGEVNVTGTYMGYSCGTGGVCGWNVNGSIKGCDNKGEVIGLTNVGGVCGYNEAKNGAISEITNCYNTGEVTGTGYGVGGVSGYNIGGATSTIANCFNTGKVNGKYVNGVIGYNDDSAPIKVTNCYYLSETATNDGGKTEGQFKSGEVCYLLNGEKSNGEWGQQLGVDSYPVLDSNKTVYCGYKCLELTYSNNQEELTENPFHDYDNGICKGCKVYQSATLNKSGEYEIGNAGQLCWFAGLVNGTLTDDTQQNKTAKGVLTGNIDLASVSNWTPIGNESNRFGGTFDGKNFKVQHLTITQQGNNTGLFGYASGATIQNICIDGNITLNTTSYTEGYGSIAGCMEKSTISNCHSSVNFTINTEMDASKECIGHIGGILGKMNESNSTESYVYGCSYSGTINMGNCNVKVAAGIVGYAINSEVPITNCSFTGTINSKYEGALYVGGIFGYTRTNGNVKVTNCLQAGTLEKPGDSSLTGILIGQINNGYGANAVTNNYYTASTFNVIGSTTETPTTTPATLCTTDELKSGEICYLLNGSSPDGGWGQKLGTDSYPVPGSNNTVYSGYKDCLAITYSNNQEELSDNPVHHYDNGFCIHCDGYESATLNASDEYEIGNAGQLYWFAGMVNGTLDGVAQNSSVNAVLTADITVNENVLDANGNPNSGTFRSWMPIGNSSYICTGLFDGRGHTVSGLYFNDSSTDNVGMFGYIKNKNSDFRITNVGVVDSYFRGNERVGGVCGANYYCFLENTYFTGTVCGNSQVGGLCGYVNQGSITNCSNVGSITSTGDYVGGLCGYLATNTTIINSYNAGAVSGNGSNVGSIYGINSGSSSLITSCYYLDDEESDTDANTTFKTASQFNSGELAYLLAQGCDVYFMHMDGSAWGQQLGEDNYPVPGSPYKLITTAKKSEDNTYWATFSNQTSDVTLSVPSTRMLKVYNATVSGGKLTLSTRTDNQVAKGEGVLLKTDGEYVNVKANEADGLSKVDYAFNNLVATPSTAQTVTADGDYTLYRLTYNKVSSKEKIGFYLSLIKDSNGNVDESSVGKKLKATPGKAYLNVRTSEAKEPTNANLARAFAFPGDDGGTTDIECITVTDENLHRNGNADDIYDLQGRKVSKPTKGVYIKNNKLFLK